MLDLQIKQNAFERGEQEQAKSSTDDGGDNIPDDLRLQAMGKKRNNDESRSEQDHRDEADEESGTICRVGNAIVQATIRAAVPKLQI